MHRLVALVTGGGRPVSGGQAESGVSDWPARCRRQPLTSATMLQTAAATAVQATIGVAHWPAATPAKAQTPTLVYAMSTRISAMAPTMPAATTTSPAAQ